MMTGYPTTDSVLEALRLGATDYLEKPFPELGLVVQRMQAAMDRSRTAFEREALATTLREMKARLKKSEEAVFQRQTELDVFVQVLELRVEEATAPLTVEMKALRDKVLVAGDARFGKAGRVGEGAGGARDDGGAAADADARDASARRSRVWAARSMRSRVSARRFGKAGCRKSAPAAGLKAEQSVLSGRS